MYIKILIIIILGIYPISVYGITFDSNISTLSIKNDYVKFTSYISPSEIDYILIKNNININSYEDHIINKNKIQKYYKNNIILKNCKINNFTIINKDEYVKYIHEKGFRIDIKYLCKKKINNLNFQINTFNDFPNQKYSISIYNQNRSNDKLLFKVLTKNNNNINIYNLIKIKNRKTSDSDCDGLNDEQEKIYGTNPLKQDTDGDNYSDYEEVKASLEPLNNILGPGQVYRSKLPTVNCKTYEIKEKNLFQKIIFKILNFLNI